MSVDLSRYVRQNNDQLIPTVEAAHKVNTRISTPTQLEALQLCDFLGDRAHKSFYLRLCKFTRPEIIAAAKSFVADADSARSKGALFAWKVKQLRQQWQAEGKNPNNELPPSTRKRTTRTRGQQQQLF
ncbi:hypothetical protein IJI99_02795 [bacterium]|nr:hypothetical protein [bacterium]